MNTSITILGRKTDLLLLGGIVILTVFITINMQLSKLWRKLQRKDHL